MNINDSVTNGSPAFILLMNIQDYDFGDYALLLYDFCIKIIIIVSLW